MDAKSLLVTQGAVDYITEFLACVIANLKSENVASMGERSLRAVFSQARIIMSIVTTYPVALNLETDKVQIFQEAVKNRALKIGVDLEEIRDGLAGKGFTKEELLKLLKDDVY